MTLVILAAGMGSRYGGLKQIDPITENGEFIIDFSIYDAVKAGFDKVVFVIKKENYADFVETVGSRVSKFVKVEYVFQQMDNIPVGFTVPDGRTKPWGTAHAVLAAKNVVKDNFAVINSDDFYGRDAFMKLAEHLRTAKCGENGEKSHCCMVGYVLDNTLTENGTVSRGECSVDKDGYLIDVVERTKLKRDGDEAAYEENGKWIKIPKSTIVSMNCLGFTPDVFAYIEEGLSEFLSHLDNPLKGEYFIPTAIKEMMADGRIDMKVYSTDSVWYGVTYHEDKEKVKTSIAKMISDGVYPNGLWK